MAHPTYESQQNRNHEERVLFLLNECLGKGDPRLKFQERLKEAALRLVDQGTVDHDPERDVFALKGMMEYPEKRFWKDGCEHPRDRVKRGPVMSLLHGSSPIDLCLDCGAYQIVWWTPSPPRPWKAGPPNLREDDEY